MHLLGRIEPYPHGISLFPPNLNATDSGNGLQPLNEYVIRVLGYFELIPRVTLNGHGNDRVGTCICLWHHRRCVKILRKTSYSLGNFITNIIRGGFKVDFQIEFHIDAARTLAAGTCDVFDTGNTIDCFFKRLGDLWFNNISICAGVGGPDIYVWRIDGWIVANSRKVKPIMPKAQSWCYYRG